MQTTDSNRYELVIVTDIVYELKIQNQNGVFLYKGKKWIFVNGCKAWRTSSRRVRQTWVNQGAGGVTPLPHEFSELAFFSKFDCLVVILNPKTNQENFQFVFIIAWTETAHFIFHASRQNVKKKLLNYWVFFFFLLERKFLHQEDSSFGKVFIRVQPI